MHFHIPILRLAAVVVSSILMLTVAQAARAMCQPVAALPGDLLHKAAVTPTAAPAAGFLRLTFLGHSSFLIESPEDVAAVTDYNGYIRPDRLPDIVTMNNAHSTHYTDRIDPGIRHVLRGWDPGGGVALHDVTLRDMRVRNVPTNVRDVGVREFGGTRMNGNSIFVFEAGGLCVAHLGHLHHTLTDEHLAELGVIDVLLVPVDGAYTMAQDYMVEVIAQIQPPLVIPMHYFNSMTLAGFLQRMGDRYEIQTAESASVTLSRQTLPWRRILILPGH